MTSADYETLVSALTDANVALTDQNNEFRSTYDIMADIAAEWENLSSMEQAALAETLSGTRQQAIFYSIVEQFQEASGAMDSMADSTGTLQDSYDEFMESTQAHINSFKAAFQELGADLFQSDFLQFFIDIGTTIINVIDNVVKLIDKLGGLKTILIAIAGIEVFKNLSSIINGLTKALSTVGNAFNNLLVRSNSLATATDAANMYVPQLTKSFSGLAQTIGVSTTSLLAFSAAAVAVGVALAAIYYSMHEYTRAVEAADEALDEYTNSQAELESLTSEYETQQAEIKELQSLYANGTITLEQEAQLENLKSQNEELETQIALQQAIVDLQKEAAVLAASDLYSSNKSYLEEMQDEFGTFGGIIEAIAGFLNLDTFGFTNGSNTGSFSNWRNSDNSPTGLLNSYVESYREAKEELDAINEEIRENPTDEALQQQRSDLIDDIAYYTTQITSQEQIVEGLISSLSLYGDEYADEIKQCEDVLLQVATINMSDIERQQYEIANYFDSSGVDALANALKNAASNGEDLQGVLDKFGIVLSDIGQDVTMDTLTRYFSEMAESEEELSRYEGLVDDYKGIVEEYEAIANEANSIGVDQSKTSFGNYVGETGDIAAIYDSIEKGAVEAGVSAEKFIEIVKEGNVEALVELSTIRNVFKESVAGFSDADEQIEEFTAWIESLSDRDLELVYQISLDNGGSLEGLEEWQDALEYSVAAAAKAASEALSDAYDSITTSITNLGNAEEEMASGGLTSSTALSIIDELQEAGEEISEYFTIENDGISLNIEKYREYIEVKRQAMLGDLYNQQSDLQVQVAQMQAAGVAEDDSEYVEAQQKLAEITTTIGLYEYALDDAVDAAVGDSKKLDDAYSGIASSASLLNNAIDEINSGGLTGDTALDIIDDLEKSGELITDYFSIESDGLTLNTQKYREYIETKKEAALQDLTDRRAELEVEMEQMREQGLEDTDQFAAIQQDWQEITTYLNIYTAAMEEATAATVDYFSKYEDATSRISNLSDFTEAMTTGGMTREDALDWIQDYEQLAACYDVATNSFIGWEDAVQSIVVDEVNEYIEYLNELLEENADLTEQDRITIEASVEVLQEYADAILDSSDAMTIVNKGIKTTDSNASKLKKQIKNVWDSSEFSDARSDLTSLAKQSGLTAQDILDLASDNELLAALLDQSGVSALYLASIFEQLSLSGTGALDNITEDAIRLTDVLSEMDAPLQAATDAYNKYQESLGTWEFNDAYSNYQAAYESLGEMFENGTYGADFYRTIDYLYGEGHGADSIEDLYKQYKKLGDYFSTADNGLGFLQKLYDMQDSLGGDWVKLDSNGNYIWDISAADFAGIAEGLGMTEEEVTACVEALGMFGDFSEYDVNRLVDTFKDLDMALGDTENGAVLSEQAIRDLLDSLGYESWQIDKIIAQLEEASGIEILDFSDTSASNIEYILSTLERIGSVDLDETNIGLTSLRDSMRELGMSDEEIASFMTVLDEMGYHFVDATGEVVNLNQAIGSLDQSKLDDLADSADRMLQKFNDAVGAEYSIDINTDSVDEAQANIDKLMNILNSDLYRNADGTLNVDAEGFDELIALIQIAIEYRDELITPAILQIDTSNASKELQETILLLDRWREAYMNYEFQIAIDGDISGAEDALREIATEIMECDPEILAEIGFDDAQVDAALQYLAGNTDLEFTAGLSEESYAIINDAITNAPVDDIELDANADPALQTLQSINDNIENIADGTINVVVSGAESVDELKEELSGIEEEYSDNPIAITLSVDDSLDDVEDDIRGLSEVTSEEEPIVVTLSVTDSIEAIETDIKDLASATSEDNAVPVTLSVADSLASIETDIQGLSEVTSGDKAIKVNLDASASISEIETAITNLETSLNGIQETANVTVTGVAMEDLNAIEDFTVQDKTFSVDTNIEGAMDDLNEVNDFVIKDKPFTVIAQTEEAMKKLDEVIKKSIADKTFSIRVNDYASKVIQDIKDQLATLKDKTITVTTNYTSTGEKSDATGTAHSKGTADAGGTAKASGNDWQTKKTETALVGEIAPEIIVDTKRGIWYTVGDNGPEFAEVPKGAIVFNAAQTEALLKYGQTFSRGTALASGTAYPSGTVSPTNPATGKAYPSSYKKTSSSSSSSSSLSDSVEEAEEFLELMDWIEIMIDRIERDINHLDITASSSFFTMTKRASAMEDEMALIADEIELQNAAYEAYIEAANMVELSDEYKELVRSGALLIEEIEDEDLYDAIQDFRELYEKSLDCRDAVDELDQNMRQLVADSLDLAIAEFDAFIGSIENQQDVLNAYINQIETSGHIVDEKYYMLLIEQYQNELNALMEEQEDITRQLNEAVSSGAIEEGSEAWRDYNDQLQQVKLSILDTNTAITDLYNTIRNLNWDKFDYGMESISNLNDEIEFMIKLLSYDELYDDVGQLTESGAATMGLILSEYNADLEQSQKYAEELASIEEELARDPYNTDLLERRQDLLELQRDSILATYEERDALVSLVEEGIQVNIDHLNSLISEYKSALSSSKDYYSFQKNIEKQMKEINDLTKQYQSLLGDTTEENRLRLQQLQVSINEANEELEETFYDQFIENLEDLLDDMSDDYEKIMVSQLDDVDALIANCTAAVEQYGSEIADTITNTADSVGYTLTDGVQDITSGLVNLAGNINGTTGAVNDGVSSLSDLIQNIVNGGIETNEATYDEGSVSGLESLMKATSIAWWTATDESEQEALHNQNLANAEALSAITGETGFTSKNGVWYDSRGNPLYSLDNEEIVDAIVERMQMNSAEWASASDSARADLEKENEELAQRIADLTGMSVTRSNGVWYIGDQELYDNGLRNVITGLVDQMKANSEAWNNASASQQQKLSDENISLADSVAKLSGQEVYRDANGVWWIGNQKLYDVYHTGGIVGGGSLRENEELAVLEKGEAVITNAQLEELSAALSDGVVTALNSVVETMLAGSKFGAGDSTAMLHALNTQNQMPSTNNFDIEIEMPNVSNYEEFMNQMSADNKFEKLIQALTLDAATGKSTIVKRNIRW